MRRKLLLIYIIGFFGICLIPFIGMFFQGTPKPIANEVMVQPPKLIVDGKYNDNVLNDLTEYVNQNFAFRSQLVTANNQLSSAAFKVSGNDKVILGKDGWLYFQETVDDFTSSARATDRQIFDIKRNLELIKEGVESKGGKFYFTIAPNKNSIYGEFMPYYTKKDLSNNTYSNLVDKLSKDYYIDLYEPIRKQSNIVYFKEDSHWNNEGALVAYRTIMDKMKSTFEDYSKVSSEKKTNHKGDLYEMVYPKGSHLDTQIEYNIDKKYKYLYKVRDNDEILIDTTCPSKSGKLICFRDSFGTALVPFLSGEYKEATYTKEFPYNLGQYSSFKNTDVLVELVERNITKLSEEAPIMEGTPIKNITKESDGIFTGTVSKKKVNEDYVISGESKDPIEVDSKFYVEVEYANGKTETYEPFYIKESGFSMRVPTSKGKIKDVKVYNESNNELNIMI